MDSMSMSLEDIIKKNKTKFKPSDKKKKVIKSGKIVKKTNVIRKKPITPKKNLDARVKIIQKNRKKIHDAREKIAENARRTIRDARELLSSKKPAVVRKPNLKAQFPGRTQIPHISREARRGAHLRMDDDLLMDDDDIELEELSKFKTKPVASLRRTVQNDNFRSTSPPLRGMPKLPTFSIQNREVSPSLDPFDCYVVPTRRPVPLPPRNITERYQFNRGVMSAHMDAYGKDEPARKSILRSNSRGDEHDDRFESDRYVISEPKSRSYTNESAGIFANIASPPRGGNSSGLIKGHRIIVNNLDQTVTEGEMRELFSDIGEVMSAKIIRPGTAEIIYRQEGDDERAHEAYHNRILDGRPMKITLTGTTNKSASYYRM
ncbi:polymerase delta-interacting protein 3-like [Chironomus tepperi]|uniref:polymerase delta-interacting protein 3-like n=1 Tax=Chironomus tepperi TaxID=113505 RepID=UPI00391F1F58